VYRIILHRVAERSLERLDRETKARMHRAFDALRVSPYAAGDVKRLRGRFAGLLRMRVGGWRIVFEVEDLGAVVYILDIRSRGDVYGS